MNAFNKYFFHDLKIIENALKSIDIKEMDALVNACESTLKSGHKIIASGLGKNVPVCDKFCGTMLSLGLDANFLHTNTAVHGDMGMVKSGDLVIILTKSGATAESIYLVDLLKKREGVQLWLLSFKRNSVLADSMDNKLIISLDHEGDLWDIVPNHSTTINLIILQKVAMELSKRMGLELERDFKPNHPGGGYWGTIKMMDKDKMVLSSLGHTWLIDIDGTVVKHNGYKIDGYDTLLPNVKEFFEGIPKQDRIIFLTSRTEDYKETTERFLSENGIRFDLIIYGLPYGERILINDNKPSGLEMSHCINVKRDVGFKKIHLLIDRKL